MIKFYGLSGPYGFMSNFYSAPFPDPENPSRIWPTTEHYYQALKSLDFEEQERVRNLPTPREARNVGQTLRLRPNWESVKIRVMDDALKAKFSAHESLTQKLVMTGTDELVEDSPIDYFWGCGKTGRGRNELGKALMRLRESLRV